MKTTDYLAIYAAILSTLVFVWSVVQSRSKIKVDLISGTKGSGAAMQMGVYIFVRNQSAHDVHLAAIEVLYRYRHATMSDRLNHLWQFKSIPKHEGWVHASLSNYSIESGCPIILEARKSHRVFIPDAKLENIFEGSVDRVLIAGVQDQLWNNVYSRKFKQ